MKYEERLLLKLYSDAGAIVAFSCPHEYAISEIKASGFKKRFHADATGTRHRVGSFLRDWFYRLRYSTTDGKNISHDKEMKRIFGNGEINSEAKK